MSNRTKTGLEILQIAVGLGVLGDVLLRQTPWGLNVLLFNLAFAAGVFMLLRRHAPERLTAQAYALLAALAFFASMFIWRDSIELRVADTLSIIVILGVLFLPTLKISARIAGVFQYAIGVVWAGINSVFASGALVGSDIRWAELPTSGWRKYTLAVFRGLIVAMPLLLIFGALFVAADAVYEGWIKRVFNVDFENLFSHMLIFGIFGWLTAGYFRGIVFAGIPSPAPAQAEPRPLVGVSDPNEEHRSPMSKVRTESGEHPVVLPNDATVVEHINADDPKPETRAVASVSDEVNRPTLTADLSSSESKPAQRPAWSWANIDNSLVPGFTLGTVEVGVIHGLVNLLFLSFVIFQVPYLFGGMELVQNTPDFKLADYARRGFGELVAVAALVLPMLLVSHWLLKKDDSTALKLFRVLAVIQIGMLFVIMASAVQRLVLLTGNLGYGMTTVRLYPMIFMIWLAIVFVLFGATVLRGARQHFAWAALWSAFFVLGATHVLNPDAFIVRTNLALMQQGREFDAQYNSNELSSDAIPELINAFESYSEEGAQGVLKGLQRKVCWLKGYDDLRSFNIGRFAAASSLKSVNIYEKAKESCGELFQD